MRPLEERRHRRTWIGGADRRAGPGAHGALDHQASPAQAPAGRKQGRLLTISDLRVHLLILALTMTDRGAQVEVIFALTMHRPRVYLGRGAIHTRALHHRLRPWPRPAHRSHAQRPPGSATVGPDRRRRPRDPRLPRAPPLMRWLVRCRYFAARCCTNQSRAGPLARSKSLT
jgi:hypothetical protein